MTTALEMQAVQAGVCVWEAFEPAVKADLCSTAVRAAEGWVLMDPIRLAREPLQEILEDEPIAAVVLTNANHARAAAWYQRRFGAPVLAHAEAAVVLAREDDLEAEGSLQEGTRVGGDLRVLELPGAGVGEIALLSPRGSLHVGDALIHAPPYGFCALPEKYCTDAKALRRSLQKLLQEPWRTLTLAHGQPLTAQAREQLAALLA